MKDTVEVNGRRIGPATDFSDLIKRQLKYGTPLGQQPDEGPETAVFSLFAAARGTSLETPLVRAAFNLLTDPEFVVRSGVVDVVQQFPNMFNSSRLLKLLEANPRLFDASPGEGRPDLGTGILRALATQPNSNPQVIERLRAAVTDPTKGGWVLAGVVDHDTDWLLEHLPEAIGTDKNRAKIILSRLRPPALRERMARNIPRESPELRRLVSEAVSEEVRDPAEQTRLQLLLR